MSEPGEEMVPSNGAGVRGDRVTASNCPPAMHVPEAAIQEVLTTD